MTASFQRGSSLGTGTVISSSFVFSRGWTTRRRIGWLRFFLPTLGSRGKSAGSSAT